MAGGFILSKENGNVGGKSKAGWLSRKQQPRLRKLERAELTHPVSFQEEKRLNRVAKARHGSLGYVFLIRGSGCLF